MKGLRHEPDMNVAKQRRKLLAYIDEHISIVSYGHWLLSKFDEAVAAGRPVPASEFIEMSKEEFE